MHDPVPKECGRQCPPLVPTCMHREAWISILICMYYAHTINMYKMHATHTHNKTIFSWCGIKKKLFSSFGSLICGMILLSLWTYSWIVVRNADDFVWTFFCPTLLIFKISPKKILFYFQSCKYVRSYHLYTQIIVAVSDWTAFISWPVLLSFIRNSQSHSE